MVIQSSSWTNVEAGVAQSSILRQSLFPKYINDLVDGLSSNVKLFAADASVFFVIHDSGIDASELNDDL